MRDKPPTPLAVHCRDATLETLQRKAQERHVDAGTYVAELLDRWAAAQDQRRDSGAPSGRARGATRPPSDV